LEYLKVLAYPITIFILIWIFKKQIRALFTGQLTAKFKELTVTIEKQKETIQTITRVTENASQDIVKVISSLPDNKHLEPIKERISDMASFVKFDEYDRIVLRYLKERNGDADMNSMVHKMALDFDPWRADKDLRYLMNSINSLEKKGILYRKEGNIVVAHKSILELLA
jgi:hypothetical protein